MTIYFMFLYHENCEQLYLQNYILMIKIKCCQRQEIKKLYIEHITAK